MSAEAEQRFQSSNKCQICNKLFAAGGNKVTDDYHVTEKYRGFAHWSCNINLNLIEKAPLSFPKLKSCNRHLIIQEIGKFNVKINLIPDESEKYIAFAINKNLVFIKSMQFMNSIVDALVKNLSYNGFKHSSHQFSGDLLQLIKQKIVYPQEYLGSFRKFFDAKLSDRCNFFSSLKDDCISEKDYSHVINVWNTFKMNTMGNYHDLYLKTDVFLLADVLKSLLIRA